MSEKDEKAQNHPIQRKVIGTGITRRFVEVKPLTRASWQEMVPKPWAEATTETRQTCIDVLGHEGLAGEYEIDSESWFAAEILRRLTWVDKAIKDRDVQKVARYALQAGELIATADLKFAWEPYALRALENPRRGAIAKQEKHIAPKKQEVRDWWLKWQADPSLYKNKTAFDERMADKVEISTRVAAKWRKELEKGVYGFNG